MRAGRLRHRVTIQRRLDVRDTYGDVAGGDWEDVASVWAAVEPLRGREFAELQRAGAEVTTRVVMRYRSGIEPQMRVKYGAHVYDIESVINVDERDRELQLMCREVL
jgi:SPP1 family predicted phage head-tail adaptor